jgi:hypothetical protein
VTVQPAEAGGQDVQPGTHGAELVVLLATYVVLAAIGVVLAVIEAFLVPQRMFGGIEGLSAVLAFVGNVAVGSLGGIGTRTTTGAILPIASWFVAVGVLTTYSPGGDVVIAGKLPADPGVVVAGTAFLILGILAGGVALVVTVRSMRSGWASRTTPSGLTRRHH